MSIGDAIRQAMARAAMRRGSATLADGEIVSLTGTVVPIGDVLVAPVSGKPCVVFTAQARIFVGFGRNGRLVGKHVEVKAIPFELVATSARVVVDPTEHRLLVPLSPSIPRSIERELAWVDSVRPPYGDPSCEEACIEPGARIVVRGIAQRELDETATAETGFREPPTRFRIIGDPRRPVLIDRA
ncbi:MAG TPA: hypothetical protein VGG28_32750 [Kofleriaceae bacterium]|jgi:hypothetical protein